jgi:hypothetical protein
LFHASCKSIMGVLFLFEAWSSCPHIAPQRGAFSFHLPVIAHPITPTTQMATYFALAGEAR